MWFLLIFISATFSALSMVAMKLGVQGVNPVLASAMSTIIVFLISWFVVVASAVAFAVFVVAVVIVTAVRYYRLKKGKSKFVPLPDIRDESASESD